MITLPTPRPPATPADQKDNALPGQNAVCVSLLIQPSTVRTGKEKAFHNLRCEMLVIRPLPESVKGRERE